MLRSSPQTKEHEFFSVKVSEDVINIAERGFFC